MTVHTKKPLENLTVLSFESRLSDSTAQLLRRQGAKAISAPSMQEVPLENHSEAFHFAEKLFAGDIDILICTTGVGTEMMIKTLQTKYDLSDILRALSDVIIVIRGPKPAKVLRKYEVPADIKVPEPNTWKEILSAMDENDLTSDLKGKRVAIQEYGESNEKLNKELLERGAKLEQVPIYRWELPDDPGPLKNGIRSITEGNVDVVLFTSKTQVNHMMEMAVSMDLNNDLRDALNQKTIVASIGPVCSKGLEKHGIHVDFEPSRPKLGVFINELAGAMPAKK